MCCRCEGEKNKTNKPWANHRNHPNYGQSCHDLAIINWKLIAGRICVNGNAYIEILAKAFSACKVITNDCTWLPYIEHTFPLGGGGGSHIKVTRVIVAPSRG